MTETRVAVGKKIIKKLHEHDVKLKDYLNNTTTAITTGDQTTERVLSRQQNIINDIIQSSLENADNILETGLNNNEQISSKLETVELELLEYTRYTREQINELTNHVTFIEQKLETTTTNLGDIIQIQAQQHQEDLVNLATHLSTLGWAVGITAAVTASIGAYLILKTREIQPQQLPTVVNTINLVNPDRLKETFKQGMLAALTAGAGAGYALFKFIKK